MRGRKGWSSIRTREAQAESTRRAGGSTAAALIALCVLSGCAGDEVSRALSVVTEEAIEAHTRFLASDLLEGRGPGTGGSELAASYVATQFGQAGLEPAGDSGFLQRVPLVSIESSARFSLRAPGGAEFRATYGEDFIAWSSDTVAARAVDGDLVFVGYGIRAPEYDWDDYKDVDVSGKILLMLGGDPDAGGSGRFRGDTLTYFGFPAFKLEEAARRGAAAAFILHSPDLGYSWDAVWGVRSGQQLWPQPDGASARLGLEGWLAQDAARQIVSMAGLDFETLIESAGSENFLPIPLQLAVSSRVDNRSRSLVDFNVAGLLPGSDPELAEEVVIVLAHYDHLGVGPALDSDSIYNGCYDNASGTALLLTLANAFGQLSEPPARSLLFLAVTAEEPGHLGSGHYVANPLLPLAGTVAAINIDGANLRGLTTDVVVLGAEESGLGSIVAAAVEHEDLSLAGDQVPERGDLYGSDQFSFMRRGVPVAHVQHGLDYVGRMPGWGRQMLEEYYVQHYHRPSDECQPDIDFAGAVQQARVVFRVALGAANAAERPLWREGTQYREVQDSLLLGTGN